MRELYYFKSHEKHITPDYIVRMTFEPSEEFPLFVDITKNDCKPILKWRRYKLIEMEME